ncbi:MAG: PKD domain-containing protein [Candidatus Thermoplasmatota archaeon]|nr:PKD domain-containing protein [Candidatus Thermoplasmatota archaeon]
MNNKKVMIAISTLLIIGIFSGCVEQQTEIELKAIFDYNPTEDIFINTTISFVDKSTGENIISRSWNFGDGTTLSVENPIHAYDDIGTYEVILKITGPDGEISNSSQNITITYKPPVANFDHPTENITVNTELTFTDTSEPGDANITSWLWAFGDGTSSTEQNPLPHVYTEDKVYAITLTVTDANEMTNTKTVWMSVA